MTREEAIEKLQKQKERFLEEYVDFSGIAEAYDMAIEALTHDKHTETHGVCSEQVTGKIDWDGDCISRQAAIDVTWFEPSYTDPLNVLTEVRDRLKVLPSAQPEPIRINLNESIKVKLTDLGKEIYYHQYDRTNQIVGREICKPKFPKEDENGYTEFQLWCFIELYGEHMGLAMPNVIKPLEIVYER